MKHLSDIQIRLNIVREWLFIALLACAPFSFNPSISTPALGFVSFRIGLYQLLIVAFVLVMLPVLWQSRKTLIKDPLVLLPALVLAILAGSSPLRSLYPLRSVLLSSSFLLLLALLISGWTYAKTRLTKELQHTVFRAVVMVGLTVASFSLLQFIYNSFNENTLGLCANCGASVFGFPRVNGLAAEPQFFASSLIPPIMLVYGYLLRQKNGIRSFIIFGALIFTLVLTLSRGAFVAVAASFVALNISLLAYKKLRWAQVGKASLVAIVGSLLAIGVMTGAATMKHRSTNPDIAQATFATIIEHGSGGLVDVPFNNPKSSGQENSNPEPFESPGVIEASHEDRESAASLGLKWWRKDNITLALGLGVGNLASYAHNHNPGIPLSFTIYMQYIFMLVELGIVGLASFLVLAVLAIVRSIKLIDKTTTTFGLVLGAILVGFVVQYLFFGTYINVPYVWLYTGIGLGLVVANKRRTKAKKKS